jgi:hypothetical protein
MRRTELVRPNVVSRVVTLFSLKSEVTTLARYCWCVAEPLLYTSQLTRSTQRFCTAIQGMFYRGCSTGDVLRGISYSECSIGNFLPGISYRGYSTGNFLPEISYRGFPTGDILPEMFYRGFPTGDFLQGMFYREFPTGDFLPGIFYRGCSTGDVLRGTFYTEGSTERNFTQNRSEMISKYSTPSAQMRTSSPPRHPPFTISTCSSCFRCSCLFFSW